MHTPSSHLKSSGGTTVDSDLHLACTIGPNWDLSMPAIDPLGAFM